MSTEKRRAVVSTLIGAVLVRPNTKPQRNWMDYERLKVVPKAQRSGLPPIDADSERLRHLGSDQLRGVLVAGRRIA